MVLGALAVASLIFTVVDTAAGWGSWLGGAWLLVIPLGLLAVVSGLLALASSRRAGRTPALPATNSRAGKHVELPSSGGAEDPAASVRRQAAAGMTLGVVALVAIVALFVLILIGASSDEGGTIGMPTPGALARDRAEAP